MTDRRVEGRDAQSELALLERVFAQPESGWVEFWSEHGPFIDRLIRRFRLGNEDHEDALQEIVQNLVQNNFKRLRDWDPERSSLRRYLTVVALSSTVNYVKSSRYRYTLRKADSIDPTTGAGEWVGQLVDSSAITPFERLERIRLVEFLKSSLDAWVEAEKIRPDDRAIVEFRLRGMTFREIAEVQAVPLSHITTRFARLKPKLKKRLENAKWVDEGVS